MGPVCGFCFHLSAARHLSFLIECGNNGARLSGALAVAVHVCVCMCVWAGQDVAQVVARCRGKSALVGDLEGSQAAAEEVAAKEAEAVNAPIKSIIISVNCYATQGRA